MSTYLSPATFQTNNGFQATGGLGGFLAGMNQDYANQITNQGLSDMQLEHAIRGVALQTDQSNLPVTQANNQNALLAAALTKGQYDDGTKQQLADSTAQASIAEQQFKKLSTEDATKAATAPIIVKTAEYFKNKPGGYDPNDPMDRSVWNDYAQSMNDHHIKIPAAPDPGNLVDVQNWGVKANQYLNASAAGAVHTIPQQQEQEKLATQGKNQLASVGLTAGSNEARTGAEVAGRANVANISGNYKLQAVQALNERTADAKAQLDMQIQKANKEGWNSDKAGFIEYLALQYERSQESLKLVGTVDYDNPMAQAKALRDAQTQANQLLMSIPGYAQVKGKSGGGIPAAGEPSAAPSKTFSSLPDASTLDGRKIQGSDGSVLKSINGQWVKQ